VMRFVPHRILPGLHAAREPELVLTLGYNTAVFCLAYRLKGITNLINMDGIEWRRQKCACQLLGVR